MQLPINEVCKTIDGQILSWNGDEFITKGNCLIHGLKKGQLFFPWGINNFSEAAHLVKRRKAAGIVWDKEIPKKFINKINLIKVDNIETSYNKFAKYYRSLFKIPVIAVTGSAGKTTVKELIAHVLRQNYKLLKGHENFNISPLNSWNISRLNQEHEIAVLEVAMTEPGSIKKQCDIIKPQIGVITCIGVDHYADHNNEDSIINTKGELIKELPDDGIIIINADDNKSQKLNYSGFLGKRISFGISNPADLKAKDIVYSLDGISFTIETPIGEVNISSQLLGKHNVYNLLAAIAVGQLYNIPLETIKKAIATFSPLKNRLQVIRGFNNSLIVNDTFSANPDSLNSAIDTLNLIPNPKKKIAVIAPMYLLGELSYQEHYKIGVKLAESSFDKLVTIGAEGRFIAAGAREAKMQENSILCLDTLHEAEVVLKELITPESLVLFKGGMYSRLSELSKKFIR